MFKFIGISGSTILGMPIFLRFVEPQNVELCRRMFLVLKVVQV